MDEAASGYHVTLACEFEASFPRLALEVGGLGLEMQWRGFSGLESNVERLQPDASNKAQISVGSAITTCSDGFLDCRLITETFCSIETGAMEEKALQP